MTSISFEQRRSSQEKKNKEPCVGRSDIKRGLTFSPAELLGNPYSKRLKKDVLQIVANSDRGAIPVHSFQPSSNCSVKSLPLPAQQVVSFDELNNALLQCTTATRSQFTAQDISNVAPYHFRPEQQNPTLIRLLLAMGKSHLNLPPPFEPYRNASAGNISLLLSPYNAQALSHSQGAKHLSSSIVPGLSPNLFKSLAFPGNNYNHPHELLFPTNLSRLAHPLNRNTSQMESQESVSSSLLELLQNPELLTRIQGARVLSQGIQQDLPGARQGINLTRQYTGVISESLPVILAIPQDDVRLSRYQVLLRHQIEAFKADLIDVSSHTRGRNKRIMLGQVGIRCRHCANFPSIQRHKGSTYFPSSLAGLYQAAQNMSTTHMQCGLCTGMPQQLKQQFLNLKGSKVASSGAGRPYWSEAAGKLGLVDTQKGIRLIRDLQNHDNSHLMRKSVL